VDLSEDGHVVTAAHGSKDGPRSTFKGRWLVDAAGRAHILKNKLGLHKDVPHHVSAAWLRLKDGLDIEEFGAHNEAWVARAPERGWRNHFTNHLMGEGYFAWLIQLGTGPISLGVCADMRFHPFDTINTLEAWLSWMHEHEPQLGAAVEARRDDVMDFLTVEDYAYSSTRAFSPERWATTGEAGTFADPFLSPGSDYIGSPTRTSRTS
jgi:flavin-dependent dehydrogenase